MCAREWRCSSRHSRCGFCWGSRWTWNGWKSAKNFVLVPLGAVCSRRWINLPLTSWDRFFSFLPRFRSARWRSLWLKFYVRLSARLQQNLFLSCYLRSIAFSIAVAAAVIAGAGACTLHTNVHFIMLLIILMRVVFFCCRSRLLSLATCRGWGCSSRFWFKR